MKHKARTYRTTRTIAVAAMIVLAGAAAMSVGKAGGEMVSRSHTLTQTVTALYSPDDVIDFCYRVARLPGVSGTSLVQYDQRSATATIVIYYEPGIVSTTQLRVFLKYNRIIFTPQRSA